MTDELRVPRRTDVYPAIAPDTFSREEFSEKVVLVTGGGNGLGKAAGLAFAQLGSRIAFADISKSDADAAALEAHERFGVKAIGVHADVSKLADNERLVEIVEKELGSIDCIIFSAVIARWDTLDLTTSEGWWHVMETNLKGPVDLTRLVIPSMLKRNTGTLIYHSSRVRLGSIIPDQYRVEQWIWHGRHHMPFLRRHLFVSLAACRRITRILR
jgi:NAD(P)-dependent dehydrogenase (short-subunit alcohol dehydrogenase family)